MSIEYRKGALGALMDEYERAAAELALLVGEIPEDPYLRVVDAETSDEDCRSVQTIISHVVGSGYSYADYLREVFSIPSSRPAPGLLPHHDAVPRLREMLDYTVATLEGRWGMTWEEANGHLIQTRWGATYNIEGLLEHAIVHILRHRRQIERFMRSDVTAASTGG